MKLCYVITSKLRTSHPGFNCQYLHTRIVCINDLINRGRNISRGRDTDSIHYANLHVTSFPLVYVTPETYKNFSAINTRRQVA